MIKSGQIKDLEKHGFHYITSLTKKQIETLLKRNVIQYELFDENVCEAIEGSVRYIFRRNPIRAGEITKTRASKKKMLERLIEQQNDYLRQHKRAKEAVAMKRVVEKLKKLEIGTWASVKMQDRSLTLVIDDEALEKEADLDGCYVIKTDLRREECDMQTAHDRYKDLALVESAFRTCKSNLELRPVYVRLEASTYGHVLVVMLAYMIIRHLDQRWAPLYLTVEEGLRSLSTLTLQMVTVKNQPSFQQIPEPRQQNKKMLAALGLEIPKILATSTARVVTRKNRRKST
jgi:transposase